MLFRSPLVWLLSVTMTAGYQKIFHASPRIGFLAAIRAQDAKIADFEQQLVSLKTGVDEGALGTVAKSLRDARTVRFNNRVDALVTAAFLILVLAIVLISVREWLLLISRRRPATLRESEAVWLPESALVEPRTPSVVGVVALGCSLAKELSGEAAIDRAEARLVSCCVESQEVDRSDGQTGSTRSRAYQQTLDEKYRKINRCC